MSNSLAVAAVTSCIRYVLERALQRPHAGPVGGAKVTTVRPDELTTGDLAGAPGLNVYCYLVTPNHAWNLTDLPTRRSDGSTVQRPLAALDLHYLITCYGAEDALEPQRLLGRAVGALTATSVLGRDVVATALELYGADPDTQFLAESDLAGEVELVKLTPVPLSLEEMSKLWGVLDTPYQLSLTYLATVVLVEAELTPSLALPVRSRSIAVVPTGASRLAELTTEPPGQPAGPATTLVLRGARLLAGPGARTQVRLGHARLLPQAGATSAELKVVLDDQVPAGVWGVQVVHRTTPGPGAAPERTVVSSNALPLIVRPRLAVGAVGATQVRLDVTPLIQPEQRVSVLLRRTSDPVEGDPDDVTIVLPPIVAGEPAASSVTFDPAPVPDGTWLVRLRVDGADSLPVAAGEVFDQPAMTLPPP